MNIGLEVMRTRALNISLWAGFAVMLYCGISFGLLANANETVRIICRTATAAVAFCSLIAALTTSGVIRRIAICMLIAPLLHLCLAIVVFNADNAPAYFPTSFCLQNMWHVVKQPIEVQETPAPGAQNMFGYNLSPAFFPEEECFIDSGLCLFSLFLGVIGGLLVWALRERSASKEWERDS